MGVTGAVTFLDNRHFRCSPPYSVTARPEAVAAAGPRGGFPGCPPRRVVAVVAWLIPLGLAVWLEQTGKSGPMEALLRRGIYGRRQQGRRGQRVHPGD